VRLARAIDLWMGELHRAGRTVSTRASYERYLFKFVIEAAWKPYTRRDLWEREQEMERLIEGDRPDRRDSALLPRCYTSSR
jgi:hypothetical protein